MPETLERLSSDLGLAERPRCVGHDGIRPSEWGWTRVDEPSTSVWPVYRPGIRRSKCLGRGIETASNDRDAFPGVAMGRESLAHRVARMSVDPARGNGPRAGGVFGRPGSHMLLPMDRERSHAEIGTKDDHITR